ncbi:hypothetical protein [Aliarcobacter cryaerophilus]|uniref:hypothetical protein n=1 Tax=Aliarcobacter cryaerophilus TaxID=28198 RepID=UPI00112F0B2B|nr:hypothetical protein [Aliarcobacter cryaerophilus]MBP6712702.1 hypothetical protein [Aliarcobacter sp.]
MGFPFDMYEDMFKKQTGAEFTEDEARYVLTYGNASYMSSSKKIYCHALYCMRRFFPLFLVRLIVQKRVKETFQKENAPQSIQLLYKDFAEVLLNTAMKNYSTHGGKCEKS